ncbi:hypothetical protein T492DRAFT_541338 [Pavlovales sp. CCMP2436]|nr:hypothetical protein T492DRAFT_541338 [Pavlovales sp. CCMP2436]
MCAPLPGEAGGAGAADLPGPPAQVAHACTADAASVHTQLLPAPPQRSPPARGASGGQAAGAAAGVSRGEEEVGGGDGVVSESGGGAASLPFNDYSKAAPPSPAAAPRASDTATASGFFAAVVRSLDPSPAPTPAAAGLMAAKGQSSNDPAPAPSPVLKPTDPLPPALAGVPAAATAATAAAAADTMVRRAEKRGNRAKRAAPLAADVPAAAAAAEEAAAAASAAASGGLSCEQLTHALGLQERALRTLCQLAMCEANVQPMLRSRDLLAALHAIAARPQPVAVEAGRRAGAPRPPCARPEGQVRLF